MLTVPRSMAQHHRRRRLDRPLDAVDCSRGKVLSLASEARGPGIAGAGSSIQERTSRARPLLEELARSAARRCDRQGEYEIGSTPAPDHDAAARDRGGRIWESDVPARRAHHGARGAGREAAAAIYVRLRCHCPRSPVPSTGPHRA